jgi:hypothetical protein
MSEPKGLWLLFDGEGRIAKILLNPILRIEIQLLFLDRRQEFYECQIIHYCSQRREQRSLLFPKEEDALQAFEKIKEALEPIELVGVSRIQ